MNLPKRNEVKPLEWLTPEEVGKLVPGTLGAAAIRKWARSGKFPNALRLPNGHWKIPVSDVVALYGEGIQA